VGAVRDELSGRVEAMLEAGITRERIVLDPGLGFAKRGHHNWELLRGLDTLQELGFPLLVGASRKQFLGTLLQDAAGHPRSVEGREFAGAALTLLLAQRGVWALRVHDVRASHDALRVLAAMEGRDG
jgi:dihydropteroate synthase